MKTLDYYNQHARAYAASTMDVDFHETQDRFLGYLPEGARILDFGCGAGRDAKYFLVKGFDVTAVDGSIELCKIASENAQIPVKQMKFQELLDIDAYHGIWACSSILHLSKEDLEDVFIRMTDALKRGGIIYTSFKYGVFTGERDGRYFTDFTEQTFREFLEKFHALTLREQWISADVRPGRENEKWLNLILQKSITV